MFLRHEDFATVVRSTPLISIDLIVENAHGEFLLGKRLNRPAQGYWFVPGGRVQKMNRCTRPLSGLLKLSWGYVYCCPLRSFTVSGSTSMTTTFPGKISQRITSCWDFVCGCRKTTCNCLTFNMTRTAGWQLKRFWPVTTCTTTAGLTSVRRVRPEHPGYEDPCVWHQLFAGVDRYR